MNVYLHHAGISLSLWVVVCYNQLMLERENANF